MFVYVICQVILNICISYGNLFLFVFQVADINGKSRSAGRDSPLYKLPLLEDPSNEIAEVLVKSVEWKMLSREWNLNVSDLFELHKLSKGLLEALNTHLPDRVGRAKEWNFEKAHSILHKVREIVMWGWSEIVMWGLSENTSCQGPEHAHIDLINSVAHLTNNKDVFLCILRYHCRRGLVQQNGQMLEDMFDVNESDARTLAIDHDKIEQALTGDRNFSIPCELGVRYPMLKAMLNREDLHICVSVSLLIMSGMYQFIDVIFQYYMWYLPGKFNRSCVLLCDSASAFQGATSTRAPSLDVMLLKQQFFTESGANNGHEQTFQYAFMQHHPNLQFLPLKLAELVAKNMAD
jgi:hypothetical protein